MSLDVSLYATRRVCIHDANITHNLNKMAQVAGIYEALWRPDEHGITFAHQLIEPLRLGLMKLEADPEYYKQFNSPNGWGVYENFINFVSGYLDACIDNPNAEVEVSR